MKLHRPLHIVYFGTPDFSADFLGRLLDDTSLPIEVVAVVTQEDKRMGRKQIVTPSPIKVLAQERGITVFHSWSELQSQSIHFDMGVVFAYGKILPSAALQLAAQGYWNVHPSLLPAYRGPSPIAAPLLAGDASTGCTIMLMDEQMDHGPIIKQEQTYIFPQEQRAELTDRLVRLGYKLFCQSLDVLVQHGKIETFEQSHDAATYTKFMSKDDGHIPFSSVSPMLNHQPSTINHQLFNLWRAYYPWPGVWTEIQMGKCENVKMGESHQNKRLKITRMAMIDGKPIITHVQLEGKNEVELSQFWSAYGSQLADPKERPDKKGE